MKENLTRSGIKLSPVYGPSDTNGNYSEHFGNPGEYPFTRGTRPYSGQGWIQRELSGEGDAKRSNEQFKYLMHLGQTGLDVSGDSPTMSLPAPQTSTQRLSTFLAVFNFSARTKLTGAVRDRDRNGCSENSSAYKAAQGALRNQASRHHGYGPLAIPPREPRRGSG